MAMKEWLQWLPPPRSLMALVLMVIAFGARMIASYITNSATLLVDTYLSLCRLFGLITTVLAYKYERADQTTGREGRLRNTFGWARIEVVGRLSVHVLFAAFALAIVAHAMQICVHLMHDHHQLTTRQITPIENNFFTQAEAVYDESIPETTFAPIYNEALTNIDNLTERLKTQVTDVDQETTEFEDHTVVTESGQNEKINNSVTNTTLLSTIKTEFLREPNVIIGSAVVGLILHAINYMLLAGRELSYSRRLSVTEGGEVVVKTGAGEPILAHALTDVTSSLFVLFAGLTAEFCPWSRLARGVDLALSVGAAIVLVIFNYPYLKGAGLVLLQTVPEGLGTCDLRAAALRVPGVLAIHELHVWQLTRGRSVATAHVSYGSAEPKEYLRTSALVCEVFKKHGINLVTLQPEFTLVAAMGTAEEKALLNFANEACSSPCAKECVAPRCCATPKEPPVTRM